MVEFVDYIRGKLLNGFPNLDPIVTIVVRKILIVNLTLLDTAFDVCQVNAVDTREASEKLFLSLATKRSNFIDDPSSVDEGGSGSSIDGHGVAKVWSKELVDWMCVWQIAVGYHRVSFHHSMAGEKVRAKLMDLQIRIRISG